MQELKDNAAIPPQDGAADAKPAESDPAANPETWDWRPIETREKLKRNELERKCTDPVFAVLFIIAILATVVSGIYGLTKVDWKNEDFAWGQSITSMILGVVISSSCGIIFAWIWTSILKSCAGSMIKMSIYVYSGLYVLLALGCIGCGVPSAGIFFVIFVAIQLLYFWCVWHRIPLAEATLTIAVMRLRKYSNVMWIAAAACVLSVVWIVLTIFGCLGTIEMFDLQPSGNARWAVGILYMLFLYWGVLFISYAVHAICAGIMGTWYFATSRKQTTTDAVKRAFTTSFGSISFASFIVAVIRVLEQLARMAQQKAAEDRNVGLMILACCVRCLLEMIGDILQYLNGLAIVRVAVYGESYWTAAKRTMNMIKYRGFEVVINDDLSGMVVWLGCCICFALTVPCLIGYYSLMGMDFSAGANGRQVDSVEPVYYPNTEYIEPNANQGPIFLMFALALCALLIPVQILTTISSFVQSLYVLWADDPQALDDTHPEESRMLKDAVYSHANYQMKYDDKNILIPGGAYA